MISLVQLFHSLQDVFATIAQELMVLLVFFLSLMLWRHIGKRNKLKYTTQKVLSYSCPAAAPVQKVVEHREQPLDNKALQSIHAAESQMMKLLEQREFTRALNFFRTFE